MLGMIKVTISWYQVKYTLHTSKKGNVSSKVSSFFLPKAFLTVIAVSDRLYVGAVGIMICEHILADRQKIDFLGIYRRMTHAHLCPDYRDCKED